MEKQTFQKKTAVVGNRAPAALLARAPISQPLTDEEAPSEYRSHHMRCSIIQNIKIPIFKFYSVFLMFIFYNFFKKIYLYFVIANLQKHRHMQAVL